MSDKPTGPEEQLWHQIDPDQQPQGDPADALAQPEHAIGGDGDQIEPGAETDIWAGRTHWKHYLGRLSLWGAANVLVLVLVWWIAASADWLGVGGAFWIIAGVFVVSGLIVVGGVAVKILGTRYRVTSQRLFIERGILSQTVDQTELIRIDDVRIKKGIVDRLRRPRWVAPLPNASLVRAMMRSGVA